MANCSRVYRLVDCPSIFERDRPLAENTLRRVAAGLRKFVIDAPEPFIVSLTHHGSDRIESLEEPFKTITGANRGEKALCTPFITKFRRNSIGSALDEPLHTITAGGDMKRPAGAAHAMGMIVPTLIQTGYGERHDQAPRVPGIDKPLGTVVAGGQKHALVTAFLAQHNSERVGVKAGRPATLPLSTITGTGTQQNLVASHLVKLKGTCRDGQSLDVPLATVQAGGLHYAEVRALIAYYGHERDGASLNEPMRTTTSKERFGLVTVHGEDYLIADIGLRMLSPQELYRAQGFPDTYMTRPVIEGKLLSKTAKVRMCGNSVCPPIAAAVARAQFDESPFQLAA